LPALSRCGARRRSGLSGGLALAILDLFEDLAHPRPHEFALLGGGLPVAATDPLCLARVEIIGRLHPPIVRDADLPVNPCRGASRGPRAPSRMVSVGLLTGGYGEDELRAPGAFRVYRDAEELHESLDELGIAPEPA
jgi:hypothetical protein